MADEIDDSDKVMSVEDASDEIAKFLVAARKPIPKAKDGMKFCTAREAGVFLTPDDPALNAQTWQTYARTPAGLDAWEKAAIEMHAKQAEHAELLPDNHPLRGRKN